MYLSEEEKEKVNKLNPICKIVYKLLCNCISQVINGECNDEELCETLTRLEPKEQGYILPEDYMTVDECLRFLNMDRCQFYDKVVNKRKLKITYFKNKSLGYKRSDIVRFLQKNREKEERRLHLKKKREKK